MHAPSVDLTVAEFEETSSVLWGLSIAFYGIGDLLTTATTELWGTLAEGSPVVWIVIQSNGLAGLVLLKLGVFVVAYAIWHLVGHPHNVGVPLALAIIGVTLTTWNMVILGYTLSG